MFDEDSMPAHCQKCGGMFDLYDGRGSDKWFPGTVICEKCAAEEEKEIELDEEIIEATTTLDEALYTIREQSNYLLELGVKIQIDTTTWKRKEVIHGL